MDPARLLAAVERMPLPDAAAWLAAAGVPVFPCVPEGKRPLVEHGFREASTDARQVVSWWRRWSGANIGVPTGAASGVDVVDVDRKATGSGFAAFGRAREIGLVTGWAALVRTPSSGMHAYYPADPDRPQPSWQAARAHVDFRGTGGYVVVPPSLVAVASDLRARYKLIGRAQPKLASVDALALRDFLDPRPVPSFRQRGASRRLDAERLAGWVAALGEGERNRGLFWAACRMAEAGTSPASALDTLGPAGQHAGLPPREVFITIRSAFRTVGIASMKGNGGAPLPDSAPRRAAPPRHQVVL